MNPVPLKLILANKAYSSWSLRPWILLAQLKIPFEEVIIPMDQPETRASMLKYAPTGKCPSLQDGKIVIWESLAIIEYLAEAYPEKPVWPKGKAARAHARSLASEMHAGFVALRQAYPTNFRRPVKAIPLSDEVRTDVARIEAAWAHARSTFGRGGAFLFGRFSAADAMFAPVVNRLHVYDVPVSTQTRAYMETMMGLPAWNAWIADAHAEPWRIERYDAI
jgi:glutathione S-transferase